VSGPERSRPLHIGVDARELLGHPTGVGRFLGEILRVWSESADTPHRFSLFAPAALPTWTTALGPRFSVHVAPGTRAGTWWEQVDLPHLVKAAGADVLFAPGYTAPVRLSVPSVLVIHDVSFFARPEWFGWREGLRRRWLTKAAARRAHGVVTVSEFSAGEIERWIGIPRDRIHIVRHGRPRVQPAAAGARPPLVLFVGSLFNRRRLPELVAAFARTAARVPDARLVLVGDNRTNPRIDPLALADGLGLTGRVEWRAYVPDEELERLYNAARVFAFLSDYEGFAMTPLEALTHGAAPVLLDTPVAREVYGPAARLVPPDVEQIAGAFVELLTDEPARAALVAEGRRLMDRYSWTDAASRVLDVLELAV
jgi:glycosyltransferase involved in cell wall biosynthesis